MLTIVSGFFVCVMREWLGFDNKGGKCCVRCLPLYHGYALLLLGCDELSAVQRSPVRDHFAMVAKDQSRQVTQVDYTALPLADHNIDVIVAWHMLDHCSAPKAILTELNRVLRHDGVMIILGDRNGNIVDNPGHQAERGDDDLRHSTLSISGLKLMARELGMVVDQVSYFAGVFYKNNPIKQWFDRFVCRRVPWFALGYCLVLKKQTPGVTPLVESWRKERVAVAKNRVSTAYQPKCKKGDDI